MDEMMEFSYYIALSCFVAMCVGIVVAWTYIIFWVVVPHFRGDCLGSGNAPFIRAGIDRGKPVWWVSCTCCKERRPLPVGAIVDEYRFPRHYPVREVPD